MTENITTEPDYEYKEEIDEYEPEEEIIEYCSQFTDLKITKDKILRTFNR